MDELERRIRDANPHAVRRTDPLSERASRELAVLLAEPRAPRVPRWRTPLLISSAAAALVIALAVAASVLAPRAAVAAPPLLEAAPVSFSAHAVLERLAMNARTDSAPRPSGLIVAETWSADVTAATRSVFVQPREVVRSRATDLGGEITVYAGEVRWGSVPAGYRAPSPGTELERQTFAAGEFPLLFAQAPPDSATELAAYFETYLGTDRSTNAGELFRAITDLRNEWALTGAQTAAVLELVNGLPGVTVAGEVTDRLGRAGMAIATETRSDGAFRDLLVFDRQTGALLSAEQVYLGGIPGIDLDSPTVLDYTAWKDTP